MHPPAQWSWPSRIKEIVGNRTTYHFPPVKGKPVVGLATPRDAWCGWDLGDPDPSKPSALPRTLSRARNITVATVIDRTGETYKNNRRTTVDCEGPRSGQESGLEMRPWVQNTHRMPGLTISLRSKPDTFPFLDGGNWAFYGKVRRDTRSPHLDRGLQGGCNVRGQRCKESAAAAT